MLRNSYDRIVLIAALVTLIAVMARSQSLPDSTNQIQAQKAEEPLPDATVPVCYIQLENGLFRDLRRLCGKKPMRPVPSRNVPRSIAQPDPDGDEDDSMSAPRPQAASPQPSPSSTPTPQATPTRPTPQPMSSPVLGAPGRPATVQPSPATPSSNLPVLSNPLSISEEEPRN